MKKSLLLAMSAFALSLNAQYFNHHYGTSGKETAERGCNTRYGHEGFVISGLKTDTTTVQFLVARSDKNGSITASPDFKKYYRIRLKNGTLTNAKDAKVIELKDKRFGVAGTTVSAANSNDQYIYYIELDSTGTVLKVVLFSDSTFNSYNLNAINLASSSNQLYFSGYAVNKTTKDLQPFIVKLNYNGAVSWMHVYDIDNTTVDSDVPNALIEDPASGEVVVVGNSNYTNTDDGFIFRVSASTGNPVDWRIYGTSNTSDLFTSIRLSADSVSNYGYIIGGYTNNTPGTDYDAWMIRIDNTWASLWSSLFDYNSSKKANRFEDVTERLNTNGAYEYYGAGNTSSGQIGAADMEVDKVNSSGAAIAQFTYGTTNGERIASIDENDSGVQGLSLFGQTSVGKLGGFDLDIFKTYFNGITSCDYLTDTIVATDGPGYRTRYSPLITDTLYTDTAAVIVNTALDSLVCSDSSITSGSNRIAVKAQQTNITIAQGASYDRFIVGFDIQEGANGTIGIYDITGKLLQERSAELSAGVTSQEISVGALPSGIYLIRVIVNGEQKVKKIGVVK